MFSLNEITEQLKDASRKCTGTGVSFAGRSLVLDTAKDGKISICSSQIAYSIILHVEI